MIFVTGGAYQGKRRFVTDTLGIPEENALFDIHEYIAESIKNGGDPETELFGILDAGEVTAVTCNELGMGIVPADRAERERREVTGRIACRIAERADEVYRIVCGIPVKLK